MSRVKRLTVVLLLNVGLVTALVIVGLAAFAGGPGPGADNADRVVHTASIRPGRA